ncbi:MAG: hypothetical protein LBG65_02625 [Puniceicoccales bacterium]|jgi:hypothetical protein|nr:hypothetical protein [Puniceicoccales bacterium]
MKKIIRKILGQFDIEYTAPETEEELLAASLTPKKRLEFAIEYVFERFYRQKTVHRICEIVAEKTGIKRGDDESGIRYVKRVREEMPDKFASIKSEIEQTVATRLVAPHPEDSRDAFSNPVRKKYLKQAAALREDSGKWNSFVTKHDIDLDDLDEDGQLEAVARVIQEAMLEAHRKKAEELGLL